MLKNARNRCQATPIDRLEEITMAQTIEMTTFTKASTLMAHTHAGSQFPSHVEIGAAHVGNGNNPLEDSKPRIRKMHNPIDKITDSTKYAWRMFEPANRDGRAIRRGELSCRTTMRYPIPSTVVNAMSSTNRPYQP